ncbi:MAG: carboxymuconolactone decarboxylase family protein [Woeseiaceae bacterium]
MTWIKTIPLEQATGTLRRLYDRIKGPDNNVDNIMLAHSLRPHSMEGHMALYKYVLHHPRNELPTSYLETIGVYVSLLNRCDYCVEHHYAGLQRLLQDESRATAIRAALESDTPQDAFAGKELQGLLYARSLTVAAASCSVETVDDLRRAGFDDGEILEVNQVAAYFAYANRTVLGLGIDTVGDVVGLSPSDNSDPNNWAHQ